jgi:hypothetical protein
LTGGWNDVAVDPTPLFEPRVERFSNRATLCVVGGPQERTGTDRPVGRRRDQVVCGVERKLDRDRADRHLDETGAAKQALERGLVCELEERRTGRDFARRRNVSVRDRAEQLREERRPFGGASHVDKATRPPQTRTRASSPAARCGSPTCWMTMFPVAASNDSSANGSPVADASTKVVPG